MKVLLDNPLYFLRIFAIQNLFCLEIHNEYSMLVIPTLHTFRASHFDLFITVYNYFNGHHNW